MQAQHITLLYCVLRILSDSMDIKRTIRICVNCKMQWRGIAWPLQLRDAHQLAVLNSKACRIACRDREAARAV